jgi:hypothetical protein
MQGLLGDDKPFRYAMIAQEIKSSLGLSYLGPMQDFLYKVQVGFTVQKVKLTSASVDYFWRICYSSFMHVPLKKSPDLSGNHAKLM